MSDTEGYSAGGVIQNTAKNSMDMPHIYWEDNSNLQHVKYESCNSNDETPKLKEERSLFSCCEGNLNFATVACSEDDSEYGPYKKNKASRQDPMSHRIIEKRRRDRMNNCLADLSRLIPPDYLKKGRGRIEKTEIIEMAIKHMKHLQQNHRREEDKINTTEPYRLGYHECLQETVRYLVEVEGFFPREAICVKLVSHLQKHCDSVTNKQFVSKQQMNENKNYIQTKNSNLNQQPPAAIHSAMDHYDTVVPIAEPIISVQGMRNEHIATLNGHRNCDDNNTLLKLPHDKHTQNSDYGSISSGKFMDDGISEHSSRRGTGEGTMSEQDVEFVNGSYKYKNNIKQRFNQDLHAENGRYKRQKLTTFGNYKRNSSVAETSSSENQSPTNCSHHSSTASSEICTRVSSESEYTNRMSPVRSNASDVRINSGNKSDNFKLQPQLQHMIPVQQDFKEKSSFGVPIFVLHGKGSYYVPLTIDYNSLVPFLQNYNILESQPVQNTTLHPVQINVNYIPDCASLRENKYKPEIQNGWH